ncbi:MAG: hypothetical protein JNJ56_00030 [Ignavibacteria bacterium]|nr:hypothetical protein [Ignavibacteria bacterium]
MNFIKDFYNKNRDSVRAIFLLAFTAWIGLFYFYKNFGLYEDDYGNFPLHFGSNIDQIIQFTVFKLKQWHQGHPMAFMPGLLTFIVDQFGGLHELYILSFLIIFVNSFLMYRFLKILFPESEIFAITGALAFCLFPSDTSKMLLTHSYILQLSLMYLITASILYMKGWIKLSYIVITLSLFTYETAFFVFLGVPLLKYTWDKKTIKKMLLHILILSLIVIAVLFIRKMLGEFRIKQAASDTENIIYKIPLSLLIGPSFNIFLFFRAPVIAVKDWISLYNPYWSENIIILFIFSAAVFILYFSRLKSRFVTAMNSESDADLPGTESVQVNTTYVFFNKIKKIFLAGIILLCLGYIASFTHYPPTAIKGRLTSVHLAATFGASIIFASICASVFYIAGYYNRAKAAIVVLSLYLSLLIAYQLRVQRDFADSWKLQKKIWSEVVRLCPDVNEGTNIFILNGENNRWIGGTKYILSFAWSDMVMLSNMFEFPKTWKYPPKAQIVHNVFRQKAVIMDGQIKYPDPRKEVGGFETLKDSNVIILQLNENNQISRLDSSFITLKGKKLYLKPKEEKDNLTPLPKKYLYDFIIKPD